MVGQLDECLPWCIVCPEPWKRALEKHVERSHQKALAHGRPSDVTLLELMGKLSQLERGGLMVVKGTDQQKIFQELGVFAMSLETLSKFIDICDGIFPNFLHEDMHEEGDVSYCTMSFSPMPTCFTMVANLSPSNCPLQEDCKDPEVIFITVDHPNLLTTS
ncbi:hypothetical protein TNCV_935221 [Trichonephila clavipes]|nr:hypothetical protein TNCV_935221 [Trichonephila clavipes]